MKSNFFGVQMNWINNSYNIVAKKKNYLKYFLILQNWAFQGYLYVGLSEFIVKITSEIIIFISLLFLFSFLSMTLLLNLIISFFLAHTINWFINANIWCLFREKYGFYVKKKNAPADIKRYLKRLKEKPKIGVKIIMISGSLTNKELSLDPDIDIIIVRKKGYRNTINSMFFILKEHIYCSFNKIPLDAYLLDPGQNLNKYFDDMRLFYSDEP
jgi:predicted nucleotidyltransferase